MRLSILTFDGMTALDAIGGYEVLARIPGMQTEFVGRHRGIVVADTRSLGLVAFRTFAEVTQTDILFVPGGPGGQPLESDADFLGYVRRLDRTSTWTVGVCNGSVLLAAAGLLEGRKMACNWFYRDRVQRWGAEFVAARYYRDGKYLTGAGVSASIDTGLYLAQLIGGEMLAKTLQLGIEYYPAPPCGEKTPAQAPAASQQMVQQFEQVGGREQLRRPPVFQGTFAVLSGDAEAKFSA